MLLTTGNKSEMAVGYATLYGDMAGGFAPIKDCCKMLVYRLSKYRNSISRDPAAGDRPVAVSRAASGPEGHRLAAALRGAGRDSRSFHRRGSCRSTRSSREASSVRRSPVVLDLVKRNEYKRRQAPPACE